MPAQTKSDLFTTIEAQWMWEISVAVRFGSVRFNFNITILDAIEMILNTRSFMVYLQFYPIHTKCLYQKYFIQKPKLQGNVNNDFIL